MKTIIVGAGISGITAGHLLAKHGLEFEILEASSVYGGRIRKIDDFVDFPIDLGAEWIHKWIRAKPEIFKPLLSGVDVSLETFVDKPKTWVSWNNGKFREHNWFRYFPKPTDLKFKNATWFDALNKLVTPEVHEKIKFNTPVSIIEYKSEIVKITSSTGQVFTADKVLITVPISILQRNLIDFQPPLPSDKINEINKEIMPGGLKIFIEFKERFYPDVLVIGSLFSSIGIDACAYYNAALGKESERHVLGLFTQGKPAERYTNHSSKEKLIKFVIEELDEIFDGKATKYYQKHIIQDWTKEPFILGSYSQRKASAKKLAKPISNRIYFAGEAMNPRGKTIAVHGACESAYLAIDTILNTQ